MMCNVAVELFLFKQVLLKTGLAPRRNPGQKLELEVFEFWKGKKTLQKAADSETAQLGNLQFLWQLWVNPIV